MSPRLPKGSAGAPSLRVAVTRPPDLDPGVLSDPLAGELRKAGFVALSFPVLKISPVESSRLVPALVRFARPVARTMQEKADAGVAGVLRARWLIFSSRNAVWSFSRVLERLEPRVKDALDWRDVKVAAVGPGTAQAAIEAGLNVILIPERFQGDALLEALAGREGRGPSGRLDGVEVLFPRAEAARESLPDGLRERGAVVELVATYRVDEDMQGLGALVRKIEEEGLEAVTLTSGSAAHALGSKWGARLWPRTVKVAAIGPVTARAAIEAGLPVDVVPDRSSFVDLASALAEYMKRT